jgi:hypothetical protein
VVSDGSLTDTGSVTITITSLPDAPTAAADGYTTTPGTNLVVPAPGLLANDADEDGDVLTVQTTPIVPPANGTLGLAPDGSFTYLPDFLFVGTDSFTYRADDGTGRTADATVTITVSLTATPDTYFLQSSGTSADVWDMTSSAPPNAGSVPDWDGDGNPGLTIRHGKNENETDGRKFQEWTAPAPLAVDGPVRLQLWSTISLLALLDKSVHPYVWLYDCDASLASCTKLLETDIHVDNWTGLLGGWVYRELALGSVTHVFAPGRVLRLRVMFEHRDVWVALTGEYPSSLELTLP